MRVTKNRFANKNPNKRVIKKAVRKVRPEPSRLDLAADEMAAALFELGEDSNWVEITTPEGVTVVAAYGDAAEALHRWLSKKFNS